MAADGVRPTLRLCQRLGQGNMVMSEVLHECEISLNFADLPLAQKPVPLCVPGLSQAAEPNADCVLHIPSGLSVVQQFAYDLGLYGEH